MIWKEEFAVDDCVVLEIPRGARIIHLASQRAGRIAVWFVVPRGEIELSSRVLYVRGTGHSLAPWMTPETHMATVLDGRFVWHVFEEAR